MTLTRDEAIERLKATAEKWATEAASIRAENNVCKNWLTAKAEASRLEDLSSLIISALTPLPSGEVEEDHMASQVQSDRQYLDKLRREYRPSMDREVLHDWARDMIRATLQPYKDRS